MPPGAAPPSGVTLGVATWGGAYGQSQDIAYFAPFTKETGVKINSETYDGTLAAIKAKIGSSNSPFDIVDLSPGVLDALCHDGLLETLESSMLGAAPGGQSVDDDFIAGGITPCGVASVAWSTAIAFDRQAFGKVATDEDRRSPRHPAFPRQAGAARRPALHAGACAARRWRSARRCLSRARYAGWRRPRLRRARQDQSQHRAGGTSRKTPSPR